MQETPLTKVGNLLGIVENTSQRCICGHLLELKGMTTEKDYASARLACPHSDNKGFHFVLVIEQASPIMSSKFPNEVTDPQTT
jgi:hypothetical protein